MEAYGKHRCPKQPVSSDPDGDVQAWTEHIELWRHWAIQKTIYDNQNGFQRIAINTKVIQITTKMR